MKRILTTYLLFFAGVMTAAAQNAADSLKISGDEERANAEELANFVCEPAVVAKKHVPAGDFFLWYPMGDKAWKASPNAMDKDGGLLANATLIKDGAKLIYYSAKGENGRRNIYRTRMEDGLWSVPEPLFEELTANSDEIYPVISDDGKKLWFASNGLYGMGGYDLYVCNWNPERDDWDSPVNMGFPYSSPADDMLYLDTEDGRYSVFASNRECGSDSLCVYILEFENMPLRKQIGDPARLKEILRLDLADGRKDQGAETSSQQDSQTADYRKKLEEVKKLTSDLDSRFESLEKMRQTYAQNPESGLATEIETGEKSLSQCIAAIDEAKRGLMEEEMRLLRKGIVVDPDKLDGGPEGEKAETSKSFAFAKKSLGEAPQMSFKEPESKFDYSFQVLPVGQYAENQALPDGVIYQIHYITLPNKATMAQLRGMSPVYETVQSNGHHVYRVGIFRTWAEANATLPKVKSLGFKSASVVAFRNGKSCSISEAKANEGSADLWKIEIETGGTLPAEVGAAIRQNCEKDLAKSYSNGKTIYVISPFEDKEEAETLLTLIKAAGAEKASLSIIEQ